MGDDLMNTALLKKLGFDATNQWILYNESFQKFFTWFSQNITDDNILTESEISDVKEIKKKSQYYQGTELHEKLNVLNKEYADICNYTDEDIENLEFEVDLLEKSEKMYEDLKKEMEETKAMLSQELPDLEASTYDLQQIQKTVLESCNEKAKELQELQKENKQLNAELNECYFKSHSPPLFLYQLPLDQYFFKCESFMMYLTCYMQENFKIMVYDDYRETLDVSFEIKKKFDDIIKGLYKNQMNYIVTKSHAHATDKMIENMDINRILVTSVGQIEKETRDLKAINDHNARIYDTLINDLKVHLKEISDQYIDFILFENSQNKYNRAKQRLEKVKSLSKIVTDALLNAELVWILMQLDLERIKNKIDITDQLNQENKNIIERIEEMQQLQISSPNTMSELLLGKISDILGKHINRNISTKNCLCEYEKFCRLLDYKENILMDKKYSMHFVNILNNLKQTESILLPYVYDGPTKCIIFENSEFLEKIFKCKITQQNLEKDLRQIRKDYFDNIKERMDKDKLWRFSQLLWIWFLTEPKQFLVAIEEVRKEALKRSTMNSKLVSGIKRITNK